MFQRCTFAAINLGKYIMLSVNNIYIIFGLVLAIALIVDLGLLSKKNKTITIKKALFQTMFWILLSVAFGVFLWIEQGNIVATKYITAYLMEWSLSIDNIFVFILIFAFLRVKEGDAGRALLVGILLAIIFRIVFIAIGLQIIDRFHWLMYVFGVFLVYTGIKMFFQDDDKEYDPSKSKIYILSRKLLRITDEDPQGKFLVKKNHRWYFTSLSIVVFMLGATDIVFALDSIPTVVSLVKQKATDPFTVSDKLVIYSSNIFAVLGLRSLFFVLRGAVDAFAYLQQGIAVVLVFIGAKMLVEFFDIHISIYISLIVIVVCLGSAILFSMYKNKSAEKTEFLDDI